MAFLKHYYMSLKLLLFFCWAYSGVSNHWTCVPWEDKKDCSISPWVALSPIWTRQYKSSKKQEHHQLINSYFLFTLNLPKTLIILIIFKLLNSLKKSMITINKERNKGCSTSRFMRINFSGGHVFETGRIKTQKQKRVNTWGTNECCKNEFSSADRWVLFF